MNAIAELAKFPLFVPLISLVVGSLLTLLVTGIRNKSGILAYTTIWNRIGTSADDLIHGEVRVFWKGTAVRNLFVYTIDVENFSSNDYDNIIIHIYSGPDTLILTEQSRIVDQPEIVQWSPEFRERFAISEGQVATDKQMNEFNHNRRYLIPVLNRRQRLSFTFLCTRPNDDAEPGIFVSTPSKGVRLKHRMPPYLILNPVFGVPIPVAITRAMFLAVVIVVICGTIIDSVWLAAVVSMLFGLTGQIFGAIFYRIERSLLDLVSR